MERFFNSPHHEKNEIGLPSQEHGYEPVGNHAGVDDGTKDGYEILKVSRDELSKGSNINLPSIIKDNHDVKVFDDFVAGFNIITKTMLSALSTSLGLQGGERFENLHRTNHKSNSTLAMFRYIPGDIKTSKEVGHQKHTDIGSLTLLFSEQWGLQVQRPGPQDHEKWEFIEPKPGHAVINVGDSLRFASGHQLYSCIHQVVPIDNLEDRYSIAYFLRPENEAKYKDSNGRWVTASEWHDTKYEVFQKEHQQQLGSDSILMGGMETAVNG
ncbi:2og-Fe oxygenase family protein [Periconia macrospinosa]|uniref:2og-Fe oxygenase family protein n=1 Tax=Periconia macrospinosa TaxID=97972 RepID=A0A2V1E3N8_9PLEO|nr:2og-Fe oxygenase family protein [Periconia macrospinosa]